MLQPLYLDALEWTGERMVPEAAQASTFWEHIYRYRFATQFVNGKRVVDVACGEGYGAHALSLSGASRTSGFDISPEACQHARMKYGIDAQCADATSLPIADGSVDVVVSFETIEHVPEPTAFVRECARVLEASGTLIISTPDKDVYSEHGSHNPFHCSEMTRAEFETLLRRCFHSVRINVQCPKTARWWHTSSVSATESFWQRVRGYWRIRRWALPKWFINAPATPDVLDSHRSDVSATIRGRDGIFTRLFNPFEVRRSPGANGTQAKYLIAVCRNPIQ